MMGGGKPASSIEFLDRLEQFLSDTEGLTTEELKEDLRGQGIDVDGVLGRIEKLLARYGIKMKRKATERCEGE